MDLMELLVQLSDYFKDRMDVEDGDYGFPSADQEMQFYTSIEEVIAKLEREEKAP